MSWAEGRWRQAPRPSKRVERQSGAVGDSREAGPRPIFTPRVRAHTRTGGLDPVTSWSHDPRPSRRYAGQGKSSSSCTYYYIPFLPLRVGGQGIMRPPDLSPAHAHTRVREIVSPLTERIQIAGFVDQDERRSRAREKLGIPLFPFDLIIPP